MNRRGKGDRQQGDADGAQPHIAHAIAEEVERQSAPMRTYSPPQSVYARPAQAMIYNSVI